MQLIAPWLFPLTFQQLIRATYILHLRERERERERQTLEGSPPTDDREGVTDKLDAVTAAMMHF